MDDFNDKRKEHRKGSSSRGQKAAKEKDGARKDRSKTKLSMDLDDARKRNPKAFAIQSVAKAERSVRRKEDITEKRKHVPSVDRTPVEPPPIVVAIVGPPKVGKTTLLNGLIKNFTKQSIVDVKGPVTLVSGKRQRITFIECSNDVNAMIDVAKVADLALVLVDASYGFEMEVFEFLNICQVHGMPRIMGVLTHLDAFKNARTLRQTKKMMKHRFWTEVYAGAKLFYLSGMVHNEYQRTEVHNLGRFISVMKFRPLTWRESHPYVVADRMEDLTNPEHIRVNAKCDRNISVYGYVRGTNLKNRSNVHIPGCGDFNLADVAFLPDPCPLPSMAVKSKRTLNEKERTVYAPMSGVGGIIYDKDAVYIERGNNFRKREEDDDDGGLVSNIIATEKALDEKIEQSEIKLFSESAPIRSAEFPSDVSAEGNRRVQRMAAFAGGDNLEDEGSSSSDDEEEKEEEEEEVKPMPKKSKKKLSLAEKERALKKELGEDTDDDNDLESEEEEEDQEDKEEEEESDIDEQPAEEPKAKRKQKKPVSFSVPSEKSELKSTISEVLGKLGSKTAAPALEITADDDSDEDMEEEESVASGSDSGHGSEDDEVEANAESGESEEEGESKSWKDDMMKQASDSFYHRITNTTSLKKIVYGLQLPKEEAEDEEDSDTQEVGGGLFKVLRRDRESRSNLLNQPDSTKFDAGGKVPLQDWSAEDVLASIRDCFVTGKWKSGEDAETLLKMDDEDLDDDEEEVDGDFEDLETGEVHKAKEEGDEDESEEDAPRVVEEEKDAKKHRMEKKKKLKAMFDADYDDGSGTGGSKHFDELKKEMDQQTMVSKIVEILPC